MKNKDLKWLFWRHARTVTLEGDKAGAIVQKLVATLAQLLLHLLDLRAGPTALLRLGFLIVTLPFLNMPDVGIVVRHPHATPPIQAVFFDLELAQCFAVRQS